MAKIKDKLSNVNECFTINRYDNGFMIEVSGKDDDGEWKTTKILCTTEEELITLVREAVNMTMEE